MLKNWKKTGKNYYRRKSDNRLLQIGIDLRNPKRYGLYTQLPKKRMVTLKRGFKTKSKALAYAKAYMRKK